MVRKGQEYLEYTEKRILALAEETHNKRIVPSINTSAIGANAPTSSQRERRKLRRERRNRADVGGGNLSMGDFTLEEMTVETDQEKTFAMEVAQARREEDELLTMISSGLEELQDLALTLNKLLKKTSHSIDAVSTQMDSTQGNLDNVNIQLDKLLESTGKFARCTALASVQNHSLHATSVLVHRTSLQVASPVSVLSALFSSSSSVWLGLLWLNLDELSTRVPHRGLRSTV
uniref:Syntaxin-72 n=1 Tax=Lygus hesperus TaxID=30085 RepID=A0A0A9YP60_LYGHE